MSPILGQPRNLGAAPNERGSTVKPAATLMGLGQAQPSIPLLQHEAETRIASLLNLKGDRLNRWHRIIQGSGIEHRSISMEIEQVVDLSTAQRMQAFESLAPPLGEQASRQALASSGIDPRSITDLIVVSCTGFSAPGLDTQLVERLDLARSVRRTMVGFMGCYGGIVGLRQASAICRADPKAIALVVCVELCSLHARNDHRGDNLVSLALFADGAASAVVGGSAGICGDKRLTNGESGPALSLGSSLLIPEGRDWMTWKVTDSGFAMTLSRAVPEVIRARLHHFISEDGGRFPTRFVIHPGGPGILQAVDEALGLNGAGGLPVARQVLREKGNMSSGTVLVVLDELGRLKRDERVSILAFGPGLTVEEISLFA